MGSELGGHTEAQRHAMVAEQLHKRGIQDARVLDVMGTVPREAFVPPKYLDEAYSDRPLPIGDGQTISQPYIVALMLQLMKLDSGDTVLEIGTGSGYQTALLAGLVSRVVSVERIEGLSDRAGALLSQLEYTNVHLQVGDGTLGYPDYAPYDGIIVTAGGPRVPEALKGQLAEGGRLVCPVGDREKQELLVWERRGDEFEQDVHGGCRFVPLIGEDAWDR